MTTLNKHRLVLCAVWMSRLLVGATFIISGWAKAIDPWGFLLKANEYLAVWGYSLPRELVLAPCIALACVEFCTGILIAVGALKRVAVWTAAAMMAFMLPLTVYIAVCNPVSDCGCFGDVIVISNTATLIKNIVLVALIVVLLFRNRRVPGVYAAPIQWLVIAASLAYPLLLALIGFNIQPLVDFRPYKVGTAMFGDYYDDSGDTYYIYEKDGEQRRFSLSALPDSSWTFVDTAGSSSQSVSGAFEIRDSDGNSMNDILASDTPAIYLIVPEPDMSFLSYIHYANAICEQAREHGIASAALVGSAGKTLDEWIDLMQPRFDVYSAEDTSLKQLVRGDAALIFIDNDGIIQWKRSLASIDAVKDRPEDIEAIDDGRLNIYILSAFLASMLAIYFLSLSPKILTLFTRHKEKNA